jgi:formylglycine-generating enzyme required for sulfatase activity
VSLPNPLPDNPLRWDGWKLYNSTNYYERLSLSFDSNASNEQIEENTRQLLVWWQKKLPLKNQPSNPLSQILRAGLDEAPIFLVEARTILLDPERRKAHDVTLHAAAVEAAGEEFKKLIGFTIVGKQLRAPDEERLLNAGISLGLSPSEAAGVIEGEVTRLGAVRVAAVEAPPPAPAPMQMPSTGFGAAPAQAGASDPFSEFRRILTMSRLCLEGDDMTDDQRDAMCNLGESLGLTGGQAEDLIDEYLEQVSAMPAAPLKPAAPLRGAPVPAPRPMPARPAPAGAATAAATLPRPISAAPVAPAAPVARRDFPNITPLIRAQEKEKYPSYINALGIEFNLVTSGAFAMGSKAFDSQSNEQPITNVFLSRFYMARYPVTNAQYERFDPTHATKRAPWADEKHPVVYVNALDAERFCEWLSKMEGRRYRLPTEAEWEYAARGLDDRIYPWGQELDAGHYANFADARSNFPWRDPRLDDGWAQTAPVGSFPKGSSPFGIEDMAGNVFEWCFDGFENYKGKDIENPRGPRNSTRRIYRGGSWKSRAASLRAPARHFNQPDYSSNDVGFRVVCECA